MPKGGRIVIGCLIVIILSSITLLLLSLRLIRKSFPKTDGTMQLSGLRANVKIYRDEYGAPHIFANNEDDLYFALGYVSAQDRLWQMDIGRRLANGTLSEIFGEKTLNTDRLCRIMGFQRLAENFITQLSPESQNLLLYYVIGINTFINQNQQNLPIEFTLLKYSPALWKIEDCLVYQRFLAWSVSVGWQYDLFFGEMIKRFGSQKTKEIFPQISPYPGKIAEYNLNYLDLFHHINSALNDWDPHWQSGCSWVITGDKSSTGKPILANNAHAKVTIPSLFYDVHLVGPFIDVCGITIPGLPAVISGFNQSIAWGATHFLADDIDLFVEWIDSTRYLFNKTWHAMDIFPEIIKIKNKTPDTLLVRVTKHGPLISDLDSQTNNSNLAISLKWAGNELSDEFLAYYQLSKAANWQQFTSALSAFKIPGQNFLYADTAGNIGSCTTAAIPNRNAGRGDYPRPGWGGFYDWNSYKPFKELAKSFNPQQQFIIDCADLILQKKDYHSKTHYSEPSYYPMRIHDLLTAKQDFSIDDLKPFQSDCYSKHAETILPLILQTIGDIQIDNELQLYFFNTLKEWNYVEEKEQVGASIFNIFYNYFMKHTFRDEMGDTLYNHFKSLSGLAIETTDLLIFYPQSPWLDDVTTSPRENLKDIIVKSLDSTFSYLVQHHGKLIDDWRWGEVHQMQFIHRLGDKKTLSPIFNVRSFPSDGGNCTVNVSKYFFSDFFPPRVYAAVRQLVDLSDFKNSRVVLAPGQSGQPLTTFYKNQLPLWLTGDYHQATISLQEIKKLNYGLLILKPK